MSGTEESLEAYLEYYLGLPSAVRFAVLVKGPWGAGKTYSVKAALDKLVVSDATDRSFWRAKTFSKPPYIVVSLYGIKNRKEIDEAILSALYPWSENTYAKLGASIGQAVLKHLKYDLPKISPDDIAKSLASKVIVFDDLERANVTPEVALGYINQFVEKDDFKCIVLANTEEIKNTHEFERTKEKVIGKVVHISANFEDAYDIFVSQIAEDEARKNFGAFKPDIREIFQLSSSDNLRVLQQSIFDFARVYDGLTKEVRENSIGLSVFVKQFFAFAFEFKLGRLSREHFLNRGNRLIGLSLRQKGETQSDPFGIASERYSNVDLTGGPLSDDGLIEVFDQGIVDHHFIDNMLRDSPYFSSVKQESWKTLWYSDNYDSYDLANAQISLTREFANREYASAGEILHVAGIWLKLSDLGRIHWSRSDVVKEMKRYIDDIRLSGRLEPTNHDDFMDRYGSQFSFGLGFTLSDTIEFSQISSYLATGRNLAEVASYPLITQELLELMQVDPSEFGRMISYSAKGNARYAGRPVFLGADPIFYAEEVTDLPAENFRSVMKSFSFRYDGLKLKHELAEELPWLIQFFVQTMILAQASDDFRSARIHNIASYYLGSAIRNAI